MRAADAIGEMWNKPLEVAERFGDESLSDAVDVAARSVERGETPLRDALVVAFAGGSQFRTHKERPAAHPPSDDGAGGS